MRPVVITGTGTEIGKTVTTAAVAALGLDSGLRVGVCKPVQTGVDAGEPGDVHEVALRTGLEPGATLELRRLPEPLAPETAARRAGQPQPTLAGLAGPIRSWAPGFDLALLEGAGGVLVRLGTDLTVLDLAYELDAVVIVVTRSGLGTLNDTELAVREVERRGLHCAGTVIGAMPDAPDLATRCNRDELPRVTGVPVLGVVPAGAGSMDPGVFRSVAPGWFTPGALAEMRVAS